MKQIFLIIVALIFITICTQHCFALDENAGSSPFFVDKHVNGLSLNEKGEIVHNNIVISISVPAEDTIRAAVLHKQKKLLTVVTDKAVVVSYRISGKYTTEIRRFAPDFKAQTRTVRFSHVAGLVYLLCDDVVKKKALEGIPRQEYSDRYYRVTLNESAEKWHAIPANNPDDRMLSTAYYLEGKKIIMKDSGGKTTTIEMAEDLGEPFRSGPGDSLAQSVFLFPAQGIVCRTVKGWSLHKPNGKLIRDFSAKEVQALWWGDPSTKNRKFYVHSRTGPGGSTYLLNTETGKLAEQTTTADGGE